MRLFDGMASVLAGVHGAPVTHIRADDSEAVMQGVFREEPREEPDDRGTDTLVLRPYIALRQTDASTVQTGPTNGDRIRVADGRVFRALSKQNGGSPAADGFVYFDLEELIP